MHAIMASFTNAIEGAKRRDSWGCGSCCINLDVGAMILVERCREDGWGGKKGSKGVG